MKEIQKINSDKTELHALKQIEKNTVLIDSTVLRPGHRCFEVNHETLECIEAQYEREVHFNDPDTRNIMIKENCSYINALNAANALKVYNKGGRKENKSLMKIGDYINHEYYDNNF